MPDVADRLDRALDLILPVMDVVRAREPGPDAPAWAASRGWDVFLAALADDAVARCEREGLAAVLPALPEAPADLADLGAAVRAQALGFPRMIPRGGIDDGTNIKARKRSQLAAVLDALAPMARDARRVVDVGAGAGHLARLAAARFDRDVLGLDRDVARVSVAALLAEGTRASFVVRDAATHALGLAAGDLAVGLHACGELGDRIVDEAGAVGADVALVSCCLQKIPGDARRPRSPQGLARGFVVPRAVLGLSNLAPRDDGVEATLSETLAARRARYALARLLRARGLDLEAGEAMRGINRRRARHGLPALAAEALALRGLAPPTEPELDAHTRATDAEFPRVRRYALARDMLARPLERAVVLDRAAALAARGYDAGVWEAFDLSVSPRNLAVLARAPR